MPDKRTKLPWVKPEVRKIAVTEELLDIFARQTREQADIPVKRAK